MFNFSSLLSGVIIGAIGWWAFAPSKIETIIEKVEIEVPIVETVTVIKEIEIPIIETVTVIKEIEVPKIIYKEIVKEVEIEVPRYIEKPVIQTINTTRVIYKSTPEVESIKELVKAEEVECLTLNIYREANNQSVAGMIAVGRVVMNRVMDRRYPPDTCSVIFEGPIVESWKTRKDPSLSHDERIYYPRRDRCQFSWYCDGKTDELINKENNRAWKTAEDIAYQILAFDKWRGVLEGATHYHATYVNPSWRHKLKRIAIIDDHIFYKPRG